MKNKVYYEKSVLLTNTKTDVSVKAEADNVRPMESFDAYVSKNKIKMKWNGKTYVGNVFGMEMTSDGPKEIQIKKLR